MILLVREILYMLFLDYIKIISLHDHDTKLFYLLQNIKKVIIIIIELYRIAKKRVSQ